MLLPNCSGCSGSGYSRSLALFFYCWYLHSGGEVSVVTLLSGGGCGGGGGAAAAAGGSGGGGGGGGAGDGIWVVGVAIVLFVVVVLLYYLVLARAVDPVRLLQLQEWKRKENLLAPALGHRSTWKVEALGSIHAMDGFPRLLEFIFTKALGAIL